VILEGYFYPWVEENTKRITESAGIYQFFTATNALIYIGSTSNLREQFREYWTTNFHNDPRKQGTKKYKREITRRPTERGKALLAYYLKRYGYLPTGNQDPPYARA
jgi:excinuclease UvrABC nuclease subunit